MNEKCAVTSRTSKVSGKTVGDFQTVLLHHLQETKEAKKEPKAFLTSSQLKVRRETVSLEQTSKDLAISLTHKTSGSPRDRTKIGF